MREYSRVDAHIPLQVRLVPEAELQSLWSRTSAEAASVLPEPLPDLEDSKLNDCLKVINTKLDAIIDLLTHKNREVYALVPVPVNISGSGMSFLTTEHFEPGDVLELKMMIPTSGDTVYYVYGEVVKLSEATDGRNAVFVKFNVIDEDIRDQIVRFVFEKQREDLRKKKRE